MRTAMIAYAPIQDIYLIDSEFDQMETLKDDFEHYLHSVGIAPLHDDAADIVPAFDL